MLSSYSSLPSLHREVATRLCSLIYGMYSARRGIVKRAHAPCHDFMETGMTTCRNIDSLLSFL